MPADHRAAMLDLPYLDVLRDIRHFGIQEPNRTGIDSIALPGSAFARYDLREYFPLFTHKKMGFVQIVRELMWFLTGSTNAKVLEDQNVSIWKNWGGEDRDMGPSYGDAFRKFSVPASGCGSTGACSLWDVTTDQLQQVLTALRNDPTSRRHVITLWNPHTWQEASKKSLANCHGTAIQFKIQMDQRGQRRLHCAMTQRSCDMFLGVPFNVASYALLTHLIASWLGIEPGIFSHTMNDAHIYVNHLKEVDTVLDRPHLVSPQLRVNWHPRIQSISTSDAVTDFFGEVEKMLTAPYEVQRGESQDSINTLKMETQMLSIELALYNPHPSITAPVAV